jgi:dynein heavy chain
LQEIEFIWTLFEQQKHDPPATKNQPPVAGAVNWARSLFSRVRKTMNRISDASQEELLSESGQSVKNKYKEFARSVMRFEKSWFNQWAERVDDTATEHLKAPVLATDQNTGDIVINFHSELSTLIRETRYLDRMGFTIPDTALNVTLQESKYHKCVEGLRAVVKQYKAVAESLTPIERELMKQKKEDLDVALRPGFTRLNWNSLAIMGFVDEAERKIDNFNSLVDQVQKKSSNVQKIIDSICATNLVPDPEEIKEIMRNRGGETASDGSLRQEDEHGLLRLSVLLQEMETYRADVIEQLVRKYKDISPLLIKVEEAMFGTNTGRKWSERLKDGSWRQGMESYYAHWEQQVFSALSQMVINSLTKLKRLLSERKYRGHSSATADAFAAKGALFRVSAGLQAQQVVLSPAPDDVQKQLMRLVHSVIGSTRIFLRWMAGTCIETTPQPVPGGKDGEELVWSFHDDISGLQDVYRLRLALEYSVVQRTRDGLAKYIDSWSKHSSLWKQGKRSLVERFVAKNPSTSELEHKLASYTRTASDVDNFPATKRIDFVTINADGLITSIKHEALLWVAELGNLMRTGDLERVRAIEEYIAGKCNALDEDTSKYDVLINTLNVIAEIRNRSMHVEIECCDLEERFRMRELYGCVGFDDNELEGSYEAEKERIFALRQQWVDLLAKATRIDSQLGSVKQNHMEDTESAIAAFERSVSEFNESIDSYGPGSSELDSPASGVQLLEEYNCTLREMQNRSEELINAQKLFGMSLTSYPKLVEAESKLSELQSVFDVYLTHKENLDSFSSTLWADVDINKIFELTQQVQKIMAERKDLSGLSVYKLVQSHIERFEQSLPLIRDLKSNALRDRHWNQIMHATGMSFDFDPSTFTVANVFELKVEKHADKISQIVQSATKELKIEEELKKLKEVWQEQKLTLVKYALSNFFT